MKIVFLDKQILHTKMFQSLQTYREHHGAKPFIQTAHLNFGINHNLRFVNERAKTIVGSESVDALFENLKYMETSFVTSIHMTELPSDEFIAREFYSLFTNVESVSVYRLDYESLQTLLDSFQQLHKITFTVAYHNDNQLINNNLQYVTIDANMQKSLSERGIVLVSSTPNKRVVVIDPVNVSMYYRPAPVYDSDDDY